ncbi:MAG TPA: hypothetical protein VHF01_16150 [Candidatus Acidoferrum sp.]|nr:hypothetical protein [Candidatus Acidoferrum sp.]
MNHVNPSMSSGSSPGSTIVLAPCLPRIPASAEHLETSPSFVPSKSLVVSKRELPAVLRNDVPPLHIAGTAAKSLIVTPNRLPGVLHLDVGKQIQHRGQTVRILNVHENVRLVVPVGEEEHRAFWIPRRAADRKNFKRQQIKRNRRSSGLTLFYPPASTGERRPNAETVSLAQWENLISEDLYHLTKSLGDYENRLISKSFWSYIPLMMLMQRPTRHERNLLEQKTRQKYTALKEKLRERQLRQIIAESRLPEEKQFAVYDVIALGQLTENVAATRGMSSASLANTVRRVTTKVNQRYQEALSREAAAQGIPAVFG